LKFNTIFGYITKEIFINNNNNNNKFPNQDYFKGDQSASRSPGSFVLSGE
jgi:hypothetical protein